ncbi:hypothetical protein CYLTODRAFT_439588 [Cylindrobasidium torrendii FP15055 ss-10]|uniref:Zn(2)-C6 fungal-type domain-containing protein n=1 Tax=Cylindrobasidium torrendii FP15055 ss-10 TaxID=1314674 RepID=A0A0D7BUU2_9AGAR|nr:hypothetical protein CYLTODRAFT_439588 [Cylindrobasidium torrendii FP15055 ss-10]
MKRGSNSDDSTPKRRKASQACTVCRKSKTRCELPDAIVSNEKLRCHRCKILNVECSFESSNIIHLSGSTSTVVAANTSVSQPQDTQPKPVQPAPTPTTYTLPSPYEVPRQYPHSINCAKDLIVEDLLPCPFVPWGNMFIPGGFDWTAAPVLSIHELSTNTWLNGRVKKVRPNVRDERLADIISSSQITRLLDIFDTQYLPWLCQVRIPRTDLLDLVCCTIASRHLDPLTQEMLTPRMLMLTEHTLQRRMATEAPSLEFIQALIILAFWTPIANDDGADSYARIKAAIEQSKLLGLDKAPEQVLQLRRLCLESSEDFARAVERSRMCSIISTVEAVQNLGTGKDLVTKRSLQHYKAIELSALSNALERERDLRLSLVGQLMDLADAGRKIVLEGPHTIEPFYEQVQSLLVRMDFLYTPLAPLHVVSTYDSFNFHMLVLQHHGCRLLTTHHALRELRVVLQGHKNQTWIRAKYHGTFIVSLLGRDSIKTAQSMLMIFLTHRNEKQLVACPDSLFNLVAFATTFLIVSNFSMQQMNCAPLGAACDKLISMTVEVLSMLASGPDHVLAKYAHVISRLISVWDRRQESANLQKGSSETNGEQQEALARNAIDATDCPSTDTPETAGTTDSEATTSAPPEDAPMTFDAPSHEEWMEGNGSGSTQPDIFMDPSFWASFMDNMSTTNVDWTATNGSMF